MPEGISLLRHSLSQILLGSLEIAAAISDGQQSNAAAIPAKTLLVVLGVPAYAQVDLCLVVPAIFT